MAGIEDFVVEQIVNDFRAQQNQQDMSGMQQNANAFPQQADAAMDQLGFGVQAQQPQATMVTPPGPPGPSPFLETARYAGNIRETGLPEGAVSDPRAPQGFTIADPALRAKYSQFAGRQNANASSGNMDYARQREADAQKFKVLEALKGLDPSIQGTILKRLGIDAGAVKSKLEQEKELLAYKQKLEQPQNDVANAIKMMLATQGGQKNAAELMEKTRTHNADQAAKAQGQQMQLMRVLATLMQNDTTGKMQGVLGPMLMQLLQASGVNLGGPKQPQQQQPQPSGPGMKSGIKITREPPTNPAFPKG